VRPRTILLVAAGVLVAGMLVFLAIESSRDSASAGGGAGGDGDDDSARARKGGSGSVAARLPAPRAGRGGGEAAPGDDDVATTPETADPAPVRKAPFPKVPVPAVGPAAGAAASMPEAPTTSNTDPEQDEKMASATAAYDKGDYQAAQERALAVLESSPRHIKALRIVVSTSCMFGEMERARELNARLPRKDQDVMRKRCQKYGGQL
jgi:hypothetical protein